MFGGDVAVTGMAENFVPYDRPVRAAFIGLGRIYDLNVRAYLNSEAGGLGIDPANLPEPGSQ